MSKEVRVFIRKNVFNATKSGVCRELVLRHYSVAGAKTGSEVQRFEIEKHHETEDGVEDLASQVLAVAESEARALRGVQSYVLQAYHGENERATGRKIFRVEAEEDTEEDALSSEEASPKGMLAQQMRHNEAILRTAVKGQTEVMAQLVRMTTRQADHIERLEDARIRDFAALEQVHSMQHDREMDVMKANNKAAMIKELMGKVNVLLPVIAKKMLPPGQAEMVPMPFKEAMAGFFESLTDTQRSQIFGALGDEQKAVLMEMFGVMQQQ